MTLKSVDQARKKPSIPDEQDAVGTSSPKATSLPNWPAISTGVHTSPHSDELIHNFGTRTGAKKRHHRQRHWPRALVRTVMARERCPHNTTISKPRRHHPGSGHDRWCCDSPLPRSLQQRQQNRRLQPRLRAHPDRSQVHRGASRKRQRQRDRGMGREQSAQQSLCKRYHRVSLLARHPN